MLKSGGLLTNMFMLQGFNKSLDLKFYRCYKDIIDHYSLLLGKCWLVYFILIVRPFLKTYFDYLLLRSAYQGIWLTAGVTSLRECLLILCTWFHLWFVQRSMFALILIWYSLPEFLILIGVRYLHIWIIFIWSVFKDKHIPYTYCINDMHAFLKHNSADIACI